MRSRSKSRNDPRTPKTPKMSNLSVPAEEIDAEQIIPASLAPAVSVDEQDTKNNNDDDGPPTEIYAFGKTEEELVAFITKITTFTQSLSGKRRSSAKIEESISTAIKSAKKTLILGTSLEPLLIAKKNELEKTQFPSDSEKTCLAFLRWALGEDAIKDQIADSELDILQKLVKVLAKVVSDFKEASNDDGKTRTAMADLSFYLLSAIFPTYLSKEFCQDTLTLLSVPKADQPANDLAADEWKISAKKIILGLLFGQSSISEDAISDVTMTFQLRESIWGAIDNTGEDKAIKKAIKKVLKTLIEDLIIAEPEDAVDTHHSAVDLLRHFILCGPGIDDSDTETFQSRAGSVDIVDNASNSTNNEKRERIIDRLLFEDNLSINERLELAKEMDELDPYRRRYMRLLRHIHVSVLVPAFGPDFVPSLEQLEADYLATCQTPTQEPNPPPQSEESDATFDFGSVVTLEALLRNGSLRRLLNAALESDTKKQKSEDEVTRQQHAIEAQAKQLGVTADVLHQALQEDKEPKAMHERAGAGVLWNAESLQYVQMLGNGAFGLVLKARSKIDPTIHVAVKLEVFEEHDVIKYFVRPYLCWAEKLYGHKNIAQVLGFFVGPTIRIKTGSSSKSYVAVGIIMEMCVGTLAAEIEAINVPGFNVGEKVRRIVIAMQQLMAALAACAEKRVLHRDIKPANVLFDRDGTLKVADFGLARTHAPDGTQNVGTTHYIAPEESGEKMDVYSAGVVLYELMVGRLQKGGRKIDFTNDGPQQAIDDALKKAGPIGDELKKICKQMVKKDPDERISAADAKTKFDILLGKCGDEARP